MVRKKNCPCRSAGAQRGIIVTELLSKRKNDPSNSSGRGAPDLLEILQMLNNW